MVDWSTENGVNVVVLVKDQELITKDLPDDEKHLIRFDKNIIFKYFTVDVYIYKNSKLYGADDRVFLIFRIKSTSNKQTGMFTFKIGECLGKFVVVQCVPCFIS